MKYKSYELSFCRCRQKPTKRRFSSSPPLGPTNCSYWRIIKDGERTDTALNLKNAKARINEKVK